MNAPHYVKSPVLETEMFFGRSHEISEIANFLCRNQSVSIIGPKKIGKSSLMIQLTRSKILKTMESVGNNQFVYTDCYKLSDFQPGEILTYFYNEIASQLDKSDRGPKSSFEINRDALTWLDFEIVLHRLCRSGIRVIFMLDDVECLMMNPNLEVSFFNTLRSLASRLRVVYLTASEKPLMNLSTIKEQAKFLSSPFFNIFAQVYLSLLSEVDAYNLIGASSMSAGIELSPQTQDFIYQLVGGHPFGLKVARAYAFENPLDFMTIEQRTRLELEKLFQYYWTSLTLTERDFLRHIDKVDIHKPLNPKVNSVLQSLTQKCLLVQEETTYKYPAKLWGEFISTMV